MSHFKVLVITKNGTEDEIDAALAPFHEFECTNRDEYVVDVDVTQKARDTYETSKAVLAVKNPDGTIESAFSGGEYKEKYQRFLVTSEGRDWDKRLVLTDGYEEVEALSKGVESFEDWVQGYYGHEAIHGFDAPRTKKGEAHRFGWIRVIDGKVVEIINRTNPNSKWDWYVIGGRYAGCLVDKNGTVGDSFRRGDLDLSACYTKAFVDRWKWIGRIFRDNPELEEDLTRLKDALVAHNYADEYYKNNPWMFKDATHSETRAILDRLYPDRTMLSKSYDVPDIDFTVHDSVSSWAASVPPIRAYAYVGTDGEWRAIGNMGWFGVSTGETSEDTWYKSLSVWVHRLPEDHWVTVVDCHI